MTGRRSRIPTKQLSICLTSLLTACVASVCQGQLTQPVVIADFDGSSTGAATAANLNAGTLGGTWTVNDLQESAIIADTVNTGNALSADRGPYDFDLSGFGTTTLAGSSLSFDAYINRTSGNANSKKNFIVVSNGLGDELLRLVLTTDGSAGGTPQGRLRHTTSSGNGVGTEANLINNLQSAAGGGFDPNDFSTFDLEFAETSYDLFVDGSLVGDDLAYRNAAVDFDTVSLLGSGGADNTAAGAFFDNIVVSAAVPEPAAIVLWTLLGAGLLGYGATRGQR